MSEMESVLLIRNSVYKVFLMLLLSILKERLFSLDIQLPENLKRISTTSSLVRNLLGQELLQQEAEMMRRKVASNQMLLLIRSMDSSRHSMNFQSNIASKIQLRKLLQVCQKLSAFLSINKSSIAKLKSSATNFRTIKSLLVLKRRSLP